MISPKTYNQHRAPPPPETAETGPATKNSEAEAAAATSLIATVALSTAFALSSLCDFATAVQVHLRADKLGLRYSQPTACRMHSDSTLVIARFAFLNPEYTVVELT